MKPCTITEIISKDKRWKQNKIRSFSTYLVKLFYISRMMNQTISTMGSKTLVCLHFKTMSLLDIHTYSYTTMDVLGLEFLSWKMTRSVSFESEKCISQQKYTREHVERKRLMIPLAWLKLAIRLLIIFFFSLSFLFFSFSLYSWQSIIICKKSSLLYNLLNQVSWDQINLSISTRFYSGLKILKKLEQS